MYKSTSARNDTLTNHQNTSTFAYLFRPLLVLPTASRQCIYWPYRPCVEAKIINVHNTQGPEGQVWSILKGVVVSNQQPLVTPPPPTTPPPTLLTQSLALLNMRRGRRILHSWDVFFFYAPEAYLMYFTYPCWFLNCLEFQGQPPLFQWPL